MPSNTLLKHVVIAVLIVLMAFSLSAPWYCTITNPLKTGTFIEAVIVLSILGLATYYIVTKYESREGIGTERSYGKYARAESDFMEKVLAVIFIILVLASLVAYIALA